MKELSQKDLERLSPEFMEKDAAELYPDSPELREAWLRGYAKALYSLLTILYNPSLGG